MDPDGRIPAIAIPLGRELAKNILKPALAALATLAVIDLAKTLVDKANENQSEKTYQTYTMTHPDGRVYSGRTSGTGSPTQNVQKRSSQHIDLLAQGFAPAVLDKTSNSKESIRGREQQLIDYHGGAQSTGGTSANKINGISEFNPMREVYLEASNYEFGPLVQEFSNLE